MNTWSKQRRRLRMWLLLRDRPILCLSVWRFTSNYNLQPLVVVCFLCMLCLSLTHCFYWGPSNCCNMLVKDGPIMCLLHLLYIRCNNDDPDQGYTKSVEYKMSRNQSSCCLWVIMIIFVLIRKCFFNNSCEIFIW